MTEVPTKYNYKIQPVGFQVEAIAWTPNPQQVSWLAMHQDYCEDFVHDSSGIMPSEAHCGQYVVKHLLLGGKGHYGCLEHPTITLNCGWFPHSVVQQVCRHRIASFDVQSGRYTGKRIVDVVMGDRLAEEVFYLRPVGDYTDRQGKRYTYSEDQRFDDLQNIRISCSRYCDRIQAGFSEEHARGMIPFDFRQHFIMSVNARSLMHLLDMRGKKDAQLECQQFSDLLLVQFVKWMPEVATWYKDSRYQKGKLAP